MVLLPLELNLDNKFLSECWRLAGSTKKRRSDLSLRRQKCLRRRTLVLGFIQRPTRQLRPPNAYVLCADDA